MAEFNTAGELDLQVSSRSLQSVRQEVESELSSVSIDVTRDGGGFAADGGGLGAEVADRAGSLVSLAETRNDILLNLRDAVDDADFGDSGGGGGSDGAINRIIETGKDAAPSAGGGAFGSVLGGTLGGVLGGLTSKLGTLASRLAPLASRLAGGAAGIAGGALAGLAIGGKGVDILEKTGVLAAIESFGADLQDTLAGDLLGTLLGPSGVVGGLALGLPDIIGGAINLDPDQITAGLQTSIDSAATAFRGFADSTIGLSERLAGAGDDLVSELGTVASDINSKGDALVSEVDSIASGLQDIDLPNIDFPGIDFRGSGPTGGGSSGRPLPSQRGPAARATARRGGERNVTVNAPVQVDGSGDVDERSIQRRIERAVRDELSGSAGGSGVVTEEQRSDAFRRSNF